MERPQLLLTQRPFAGQSPLRSRAQRRPRPSLDPHPSTLTPQPLLSQISDVGGIALCRAAKGALMLSRLNISMNAMTGVTLNALAEALRFNTGTLKEVAVAGCRAAEPAAIAMLQAATKNNTLQLMDIRGVPLAAEVGQKCSL